MQGNLEFLENPVGKKKDDAMTKIMTPSADAKVTTAGQIDKAVANYRALLDKHGREFDSEAVQTVLGSPGLAVDMLAVFRRRVEAVSNIIVRRAKVDRTCTPKGMLDATGRKQYTDGGVVKAMPRGEGDEVEVVFFKPDLSSRNGSISDDDLEKEYELRGLVPADPYSVGAVNEANPAFADEKPHGTHWKDEDGNWCYATFYRWYDGRNVDVYRNGRRWNDRWWIAGLRKKN